MNPNELPVATDHQHSDADIVAAVAVAMGERKMRLTDRRILMIFIFMVVVFGLLSVRSETNARHIVGAQHQADERFNRLLGTAYAGCLTFEGNAMRNNAAQQDLIDTDRVNPVANPIIRQRRIAAYEAAMQPVNPGACEFLKPPQQ